MICFKQIKGCFIVLILKKHRNFIHTILFLISEEGVTKMDIQQTTVKTDMQSDENSSEEGDASANLGGEKKVIGFLTEWVSAYNFIKGMVLIRHISLKKKQKQNRASPQNTVHGGVPHSVYLLCLYLACSSILAVRSLFNAPEHEFEV